MRLTVRDVTALAVAALVASAARAQQIPPRPGLVLDYAHLQTDRHYDKEYIVTVISADSNETILQSYFLDELAKGHPLLPDTVSRREWLGARAVGVGAGTDTIEHIRNRTVMALSKRVYQQLKRDGRADDVASYVIIPEAHAVYRVQGDQVLVATETLTVVIDGKPRVVQTLHTRGRFTRSSPMLDVPAENWYLDDPEYAWVIKIEQTITDKPYHVRLGTVKTASTPPGGGDLDAELAGGCKADMYGIYFAYNSAAITPVSQPTLAEVAAVLKKHGDWTLTIKGHTDSIGGAKYNAELSARRAEAVKKELVQHYGIGAARLSTDGVGLNQPLATNSTLEGRARNRRVELVRPCAGKH